MGVVIEEARLCILDEVPRFTDLLIESLDSIGIDSSPFQIDHVCYRVEDEVSYYKVKEFLSHVGVLLVEETVGGRKISTFSLNSPIILSRGRSVALIELPMPKVGSFYQMGWEHCEFVVGIETDLSLFAMKYPQVKWDKTGLQKLVNADLRIQLNSIGSVKFHHRPLNVVIETERRIPPCTI